MWPFLFLFFAVLQGAAIHRENNVYDDAHNWQKQRCTAYIQVGIWFWLLSILLCRDIPNLVLFEVDSSFSVYYK